jgi:hypothetical protein
MATASEYWYVRLPDGRTLRARNGDVLRGYVRAGRIPWKSRVRRTGAREWVPLERVAEFAAIIGSESPPAGIPPVAESEMEVVGFRNLVQELFNAFDSSLDRTKLLIAAMVGLALALGVIGFEVIAAQPPASWVPFGFAGVALFVLAAVSLATVVLTRMTVIELDRHRSAHGAEVRAGLGRQWLRVAFAQGLIGGLLVGLVLLARAAAPWLAVHDLGDLNSLRDVLASLLAVLRLLLEVLCWPALAVAVLLLGPLLVIEEYPILQSLRELLGMMRRHLGRIYLCEAISFVLAAAIALPMLLLVVLAASSVADSQSVVERFTLVVLAGLALTPVIAYLIVANVFIYLNLRYEFFFSARER